MRAHYGLDKPLVEQYLIYMKSLAQGDFGYSLTQRGRRVNDIIRTAFPVSLDLGLRAMVFAIVFGPLVRHPLRAQPRQALRLSHHRLVLIGISVPSFVVGGLLQYFLAVKWPILPVARYETFASTLMPAFALSLATMATIARYMRASMLEVVAADYIRTAVSKGLRRREIVWRHQIRNAIFPVLSILGPVIASVLTGSFVIETIFAVPGLGRYFVIAMQNLDYTLVMGLTVFFGAFLIGVNFLVDVAYGLVDPRIRIR